jgi:hypothetical protein
MLADFFQLTNKQNLKSSYDSLLLGSSGKVDCGVYSNGLLTILDEELGQRLLTPWECSIGRQPIALAYSSFGDVIYYNNKRDAVHILIPQEKKTNHISRNVERVITEWLSIPGVQNDVLRLHQFEKVRSTQGALEYGECYILEPYLMLGGIDSADNYSVGSIEVYLDLVSQAWNAKK